MRNRLLFLIVLLPFLGFSQNEISDSIKTVEIVAVDGSAIEAVDYLTLKSPMRASLYSAIMPGAGQIYNGKWWKAPIVWGLLGTGVGFIVYYNNQYREFRGYFRQKLYGYEIDIPAINNLTKEQIGTIQDDRKRTRDYAIALTALAYILNIVDASVDAHLFGIKKDPDLSMQPVILQNQQNFTPAMGIGFNLKF